MMYWILLECLGPQELGQCRQPKANGTRWLPSLGLGPRAVDADGLLILTLPRARTAIRCVGYPLVGHLRRVVPEYSRRDA